MTLFHLVRQFVEYVFRRLCFLHGLQSQQGVRLVTKRVYVLFLPQFLLYLTAGHVTLFRNINQRVNNKQRGRFSTCDVI
jgi:hypothetical protein